MKVALKLPAIEVVTVVGAVTTVAPLKVIETTDVPAKPLPATVTVIPAGPEVGVSVIAGVTVNVADGVLVPSEAVTVWAPAVAVGTVKVAEKLPAAFVVTVAGAVVCVAPANFIVMVASGMKLVPVTVTVVPTCPEAGLREICDVVTVNEAEATTLVP